MKSRVKRNMDSLGENIGVYAEAKGEYTRQLTQFLVPALLQYYLHVLDETKQKEEDTKKLLWNFQNALKDIPDWNVDKVKRETTRISDLTKCDYLQELLTAVFIAHTKVLAAIRLTSKQKKLQITVPKLDHFLHRTLSDCARVLWANVYYFSPTASSVERQKSLNTVEQLLHEGILQSIRSMLPVKSILREYLNDDGDDGDDDEKDVKESIKYETPVEEPAVKAEEPVVKAEEPAVKAEEPAVKAEEPVVKPEEPVVKAEEPVVKAEEGFPFPVPETRDLSESHPPAPPPTPILVIDTEPMVRFTGIDTVFDSNDPSKHTMKQTTEDKDEDDMEDFFIENDTSALSLDDMEEL